MSERDSRLYLSDILDSGTAIQKFVKDLSFEKFCNDRKTYSAVIREFEIIGEAVGKLTDELQREYPDVEWQDIKDFRNLLIHEYFNRMNNPGWVLSRRIKETKKCINSIRRINGDPNDLNEPNAFTHIRIYASTL